MITENLVGEIYLVCGALLFVLGVHALVVRPHLLVKVLAVNIMGSGVFMVLLTAASGPDLIDPVPHALVITGIVVAVCASAVALALMLKVRAATGQARLPSEAPED
ncbi:MULTISPECIES: NADH-quinone oxidoreductase subunit K [Ectothiorhodospira]|nr:MULTISPECIES: NADH-quinone oxidoreductase subunit K [Ectothiorhodospira]MCG5493640.1 NADH-quinone oxidoreductase subunit K [Ectothiorhodospira variabilis]MCG5496988.1 NADH-quinone oxidoreductase subunit K [Ectothiorhodospira variabilis]MCG5502969.1 NADH-quinone oxidoreductase subunit K [Ectothiorhodospira variabilis]MCG5506243.1 NADH-quinone oxidoreductase subunit K [Ectothiorhodospira variabilis]MCG5525131.1 NADH-quinone oxidoreductase subunit K [Ectothiorhodospira haloalkaliphila]